MNKLSYSLALLVLLAINLTSLRAHQLNGKSKEFAQLVNERRALYGARNKRNLPTNQAEIFEQMLKDEENNLKSLLEIENDYDKFVLQFVSELEKQVHEAEIHLNECIGMLENITEKMGQNETSY